MKIKVCGMRETENIRQLVELGPDYIGFIFYPTSKRYVGEQIAPEAVDLVPTFIQKVGVFVDEPFESLLEQFRNNKLELVQLHGNELPEYSARLKQLGIPVIKVFSVGNDFDFTKTAPYTGNCDFFLFDTKGELLGGTGRKFNWELLDAYTGETPFFLSGGIGPTDAEIISNLQHPRLYGVDVNSGFETEPALKNIEALKRFIATIRQNNTGTKRSYSDYL
ncbi:N-(5'-phosphoribosyl)anthranilate isomerase [Prolixibacter bellariivorans]|uniref:N-(5'-phosphoribosyl)anthranilate isomerase n=1 Tax=Prolixibacter bellariivorans TaxID=314319 RepID=A0A5M4AYK8_9BACT|nr:phosphoribosylanthranilate isomerase [Prolixibacter bellariivorans]GET32979.1 N-(5'-phosphoribosyl)anthranilate isomerase [Prolixibacter bellariivorans]